MAAEAGAEQRAKRTALADFMRRLPNADTCSYLLDSVKSVSAVGFEHKETVQGLHPLDGSGTMTGTGPIIAPTNSVIIPPVLGSLQPFLKG